MIINYNFSDIEEQKTKSSLPTNFLNNPTEQTENITIEIKNSVKTNLENNKIPSINLEQIFESEKIVF